MEYAPQSSYDRVESPHINDPYMSLPEVRDIHKYFLLVKEKLIQIDGSILKITTLCYSMSKDAYRIMFMVGTYLSENRGHHLVVTSLSTYKSCLSLTGVVFKSAIY